MPPRSNAEKRVARIRILISELCEKAELNTANSRARCATIARELIELLKAEDEFQRTLGPVELMSSTSASG
jgi:hypothetical protein